MRYGKKKKMCVFLNFSRCSRARAGPIRVYMGPYGPLWADMDPKNLKRYVKNASLRVKHHQPHFQSLGVWHCDGVNERGGSRGPELTESSPRFPDGEPGTMSYQPTTHTGKVVNVGGN